MCDCDRETLEDSPATRSDPAVVPDEDGHEDPVDAQRAVLFC